MSPYFLLFVAALAVLSAWFPGRWRSGGATAAVSLLVGAGLFTGALTPSALPWLAGLFATAWWAGSDWPWRRLGLVLFALAALAIGLGVLPGFHRVILTEALPLKPGSAPYSLQFGLGKPLVAVALLLWLVPVARDWSALRSSIRTALPVLTTTAMAVPVLAWGTGHVGVAPGMPPWDVAMTWMAINLLFVCTAEDAFFRGLVQRILAVCMAPAAAIGCTALIFGLAHFSGGWSFVLLATAAGLGYGVVYHRACQRIEAAILAHFGVNLVHFTFFTYPSA